MTILLMGALAFAAALLVRPSRPVAPVWGVLGVAGLAVLTLGQLLAGADRVDRYRVGLLGLRWRVPDAASADAVRRVSVGGAYGDADLWVPGAGEGHAGVLVVEPTDSGSLVRASLPERPSAVLLVRGPAEPGEWRVLGGVPLEVDDTLVVQGADGPRRWIVGRQASRVELLSLEVPVPWVREVLLRRLEDGSTVRLPGVERGLLARLRPLHPSVFQRSYPLADVLPAEGSGPMEGLASFLYFRDGGLRVAVLDPAVAVAGRGPDALVVQAPGGEAGRILVAGLPHRDYPEPDLTLPERYGVRPLRSVRLAVRDGWLDATLAEPEVHALARDDLEELRLPGPRGDGAYRIRLAPGRESGVRRALVFDTPGARFEVAGQAVLRLPEDPGDGEIGILTPSGLARWQTGRPFTLGAGDVGLLARIDGHEIGALSWIVHVLAFSLAALVFVGRRLPGAVFVLALSATALAAVRLLLGIPALLDPPFVQEGQQIGLWLLPLLPWVVVQVAEIARPGDRGHGAAAAFALVLVMLAVILFDGSPAKQLILGGVPAALFLARVVRDPLARAVRRLLDRVRDLAAARPWLASGAAAGGALLLARVLLEILGWREQVVLGGTRIGVSVLFTPVAVLALTWVLWRNGRRIAAASGDAYPEAAARALLDVGLFLVLGFVGVSGWVSDFGIALVLLPGALLLLALLAGSWAPTGRRATVAALGMALPLVLFLVLQAAPSLLRFAWGGDVRAADARLGDWDRNELLLLERGDPDALDRIGERRSEALAVMRETMRSYTRGNWGGKGFLRGRVSDEVAETATREHAPSALLASQWGVWGTGGLVLLLLALARPATALLGTEEDPARAGPRAASMRGRRAAGLLLALGAVVLVARVLPYPFNTLAVGLVALGAAALLLAPLAGAPGLWGEDGPGGSPASRAPAAPPLLAAAALLTLACAGLYMVAANYGLVFFTGKNVYLLGLDSVGDALEALALLVLAAVGATLATPAVPSPAGGPGGPDRDDAPEEPEAIWWHPPTAEEGA